MQIQQKGTVLIYSLVLVILSIFMAVSVSNVVLFLSNNNEIIAIDEELIEAIQKKEQYQNSYKDLVNTGSFDDNIWCPQDFSMSWAVNISINMSWSLRHVWWNILCRAEHAGNDIDIFFNSSFTDLESATYDGATLSVSSSITTGTFTDSDTTFLDLGNSFPLQSDGVDDDFDNNDFIATQWYSYESETNLYNIINYPDEYIDNDAENRLTLAGVVYPNEIDYNIFWANNIVRKMTGWEYTYNFGSGTTTMDVTDSAHLYFDISEDYTMVVHELDSEAYRDFKEIKIIDSFYSNSQSSWAWYLQDDMTLNATITWNELFLDLSVKDYAIFINNTTPNILEYTLKAEHSINSNKIYIAPYSTYEWNMKYFGNHIISRDNVLIGRQEMPPFESFWSNDAGSPSLDWLVGWYTMSLPSYRTESWGRVSEVLDRSGNNKHLTQTVLWDRPALSGWGITGSWYLWSYFDITSPVNIARVYAKVSYDDTTFSDYDYLLSWDSAFGSPRIMWWISDTTLFTSQSPTDITASVNRATFSTDLWLPLDQAVLVFDYASPQLFSMLWGGSYSSDRSWKWEIEEVLLYETIPTAEQELDIIEYLETNGWRVVNIVAFETGDKVSDIDLTWFDDSWYTIELNGFNYDRTTDIMAVSQSWNSWMRFRKTWTIHLHLADDTNTDIVRHDISGVIMLADTDYDIKIEVTTNSYNILIDDISVDSATFTAVDGVKILDHINGIGDLSDSYSWNFHIQEVIIKDGAWATIFQENWDAASWNTHLTDGAVTDV